MGTNTNKKAAIIGSGFGGLAMGIRLQALGFKTDIYEKNDTVGGHGSQLIMGGYKFDMGPSIITLPFLIQELFDLNNENMHDYLDLIKLDPYYRIYFHDKTYLDYSGDPEDMKKQIGQFSKKDVKNYDSFMKHSKKLYKILIDDGLGAKPFMSYFDMIKMLPDSIKSQTIFPGYSVVKRYFENFRTRFLFSFHPLFLGGNPFTTPSIFLMLPYLEQNEGVWFTTGGMFSVISELRNLFERMGGKVYTNSEVEKIIVNSGKAEGIQVNGAEEKYDFVISNAHSAHTYMDLVDKKFRKKMTDYKVKNKNYSMSCVVIFVGTDKKFDNLLHHTLILSERYKGLINDIFNKKILPDDFSMYLHVPTKTDPSLAPPGGESMYMLIPVPNLKADIDWNTESEPFYNKIIEFLENDFGLEGLKNSIKEKRIYTPLDFESERNNYLGAPWSLQPSLMQIASFRPHNKSEDIENLYLVGASTHPGSGVPGVILGAKATENVIKKDFSLL